MLAKISNSGVVWESSEYDTASPHSNYRFIGLLNCRLLVLREWPYNYLPLVAHSNKL
jgi:hypothetical protein